MKPKSILFLVALLLTATAFSFTKTECAEKIISQIESIAKENGITRAEVMYHRVNSVGESTITSHTALAKRNDFRFEGMFLVVDDTYFNIEKLLFFKLQVGCIQFFFQAY